MGITQKIEEIRQKPEHVRMRYVWSGVIASMAVILVVWIFSLKENFRSTQNTDTPAPAAQLQEQFNDRASQQQETPSLEEFLGQNRAPLDTTPAQENTAPAESAESPFSKDLLPEQQTTPRY